jgi:glutathionylspermidine synthase
MNSTLTAPVAARASIAPLSIGAPLDPQAFAALRRRMILDHCKWDPQVGDTAALASFPLVMSQATWRQLARDAELLAAETSRAEHFLLHAPRLQKQIGIPWALRRVLRRAARIGLPPVPVRSMRFDFHPTRDGWRISEVNSDVPGGFTEASSFTQLMACHYPDLRPAGDPADAWSRALAGRCDDGAPVALLSAPGFMEDQQITAYLARRLEIHGLTAHLANPRQLEWGDGHAHLGPTRLGAIVRFYQAEWLTRLPRRCGWRNMLAGGRTPVTNPATSLMTESKRFPLAWDALPFDLPAWRRLLPETRDPRHAPWRNDDAWLIKSAYSNTGDTVTVRGLVEPRRWRAAARAAGFFPRHWLAQKRFEMLAVDGPSGPLYPCIGVYVIDDRAAGAYARVSSSTVIDFAATDVPLLIRAEHHPDE